MKHNVTLICDLQFGSTGKGACAGYLATKNRPDTVITAWSPNAGHTFIDADGRKFVHCMLANGVVSPTLRRIMIAPGSIVDTKRLKLELEQCADLVEGKTLIIHENAAVVQQKHRDQEEATMTGIGSTKKGSGAALIDKLMRQPDGCITVGDLRDQIQRFLSDTTLKKIKVVSTGEWLDHLEDSHDILVEGAQGFSLGINSGFYPYCTSRECTPAQIMSDTLISPERVHKIVGVMRTFPIRVANRYDENGVMIGYSGPGYSDQNEITWEEIGQKPEYTTVTKLRRRVFNFSLEQTKQALSICTPDEIYLSFCDYLPEKDAYKLKEDLNWMCKEMIGFGRCMKYMAFGPGIENITEV
jgi:adenylosuccinate synthase